MTMATTEKSDYEITHQVGVGRYTIIEVTNSGGVKGVGIARRTQGDTDKTGVGINIAINRALKAIEHKLAKKKINHPLMG